MIQDDIIKLFYCEWDKIVKQNDYKKERTYEGIVKDNGCVVGFHWRLVFILQA